MKHHGMVLNLSKYSILSWEAGEWVDKFPFYGLPLGFLTRIFEGETLGLINKATGGSSINDWGPDKSLYTDSIEDTKHALEGHNLKAILWHQGEADCSSLAAVEGYDEKLEHILKSFRKDLDFSGPIVLGEVAKVKHPRTQESLFSNKVNIAIRKVCKKLKLGLAKVKDLEMVDYCHLTRNAIDIFSERYVEEYQKALEKLNGRKKPTE